MAVFHGNKCKVNHWWALVGNRNPYYRPRLEISRYLIKVGGSGCGRKVEYTSVCAKMGERERERERERGGGGEGEREDIIKP